MAYVIAQLSNTIFEVLDSRDIRTRHLPLTSPLSLILVAASYFYFVRHLGPAFMRKRQPYNLKNVIIIYDLIQIICNAALVLYALYGLRYLRPDYSFVCQPIDWGTNVVAIQEATTTCIYYWLKILDLCDTVFFVLKKNSRQMTFLHVYHHLIVLICSYQCFSWFPGGHFLIMGLINCTVHAIMYTYYLLTALQPQYKQNVALKKMVTTVQMIQFMLSMFLFGRPLLNPDCPVPKIYLFAVVLQNLILFGLFSNFYYRTYCVKQRVTNKDK